MAGLHEYTKERLGMDEKFVDQIITGKQIVCLFHQAIRRDMTSSFICGGEVFVHFPPIPQLGIDLFTQGLPKLAEETCCLQCRTVAH